MASEEPYSSDAESIQERFLCRTPKYHQEEGGQEGVCGEVGEETKKSKFLVTEDDHVDLSSLDRSVGSEAIASDVVENFVRPFPSLTHRTSRKWTVPTSPPPAPAGAWASWAAFQAHHGEAPITEEELGPVMDSLKKKVRSCGSLNGSWWRRTWRRRSRRPICANVKAKLLGKKLGGFTR